MKNGDISNQHGFHIAVRIEDTLLKKDGKKLAGVVDKLFNTSLSYSVDEDVLKLVQYIYRRTEHTVILVVDENFHANKKLEEFQQLFPFETLYIKNESEITMRLITGDLTYYLDEDDYRRSLVNNKYAITLDEFNTILRRKGR